MEPLRIMNLDLRSPLRYRPVDSAAFAALPEGERMARFELDDERATTFDLEPTAYLDPPVLVGEEAGVGTSSTGDGVVIPSGRYLFAQFRPEDRGGEDLFAAAALEVQRDGLRRGLALEPRVYLRLLAEEGGTVCQVLRPLASDARG